MRLKPNLKPQIKKLSTMDKEKIDTVITVEDTHPSKQHRRDYSKMRLFNPNLNQITKFPKMDPTENEDDNDSGRYSSFRTAEEGPLQEEDVQPPLTD